MPDRYVKTTLVIDDRGSVKVVKGVGEESARTERHLEGLGKRVESTGRSFGKLKGILAGGLGLLGAGGAVFGLKAVVDKTKEALDQTEKFHAISGTSTQQSLYLTAALKARGINAEVGGKAFAFLGSNIKTAERQEHKYAQAQGKAAAKGKVATNELGKQATAFRLLFGARGVGALSGLSGEDKFKAVVKAFERLPAAIKKTGAQAALMKEIFGRGGMGLATVLEGGATGLTHFEQVARKFFPAIKGGQKGMEEWQVKNSEFHLALEGMEFTLGMKLIPILMGVETWISKVSLEVKAGKGPWGDLGNAVSEVVGFLKGAWSAFENLVGPADAVKGAIGGFVAVMAVGKIAAFSKAIYALSFAAPFMAEVATVLLLIKGFEKLTGNKIMKKLAEETGLLPVEVKTYKPGSPIAEGKRKHGEQVRAEWLRTHGQLEAEEFHRIGVPAPPAVKHALQRPSIAPHLPGGGVFEHSFTFKGDGPLTQAIAHALRADPRAIREITEGTTKYAMGMAARR